MYPLIRPLLFCLNPEASHNLTLGLLNAGASLKLLGLASARPADNPVEVMGLRFANPVGLAAGLDKNGDYYNALGQLGFGFVEVGTVTPRPQPGNDKPRLFRIPERQAIINRMGFNNKGVEHMRAQLVRRRYSGVLGVNIGKNAVTPVENALDDYRLGMAAVYDLADYITVNLSSPNTPGLRDLQYGDALNRLLEGLKAEQARLQGEHGRYVPLAVKIAPDLDEAAVAEIARALLDQGMDGVIATNTTIGREGVEGCRHADEAGGLSGSPVREKSTRVIGLLRQQLGDRLPIIGVGGITDGASAREKIAAGARLVQLYSGLIYRGPALVGEVARALEDALTGQEKARG